MAERTLPARRRRDDYAESVPDPERNPEFYDKLPLRRMLAFVVDLFVLACVSLAVAMVFFFLKILSFGLLSLPLAMAFSLLPLAYFTWFIGGVRSATPGMQLLRIEVRTLNGGRPDFLLAGIFTIVFWVSLGISNGLVLLVPLFNRRRRCLHDWLCGILVLNARDWPEPLTVEIIRP